MRIAVLGCGSIGRRHIKNLLAMGEDVAAYDKNDATAQALYAQMQTWDGHGVAHCACLEAVWGWRPDAVLICTPPDSHADLAHEAAYEGVKGIFVEKPLGLKPVAEEWLRFLTSPDDKVTMVGCNWRFHPAFAALRRWADDGAISRPAQFYAIMAYDLSLRADYRTCYAATTGVAMDVAWHLVDIALWCFGAATVSKARLWPARRLGLSCDGGADIELTHDLGVTSHLLADFDSGVSERSLRIVGRDGEPNISMLLEPTNQMYVDELRHFLTCVREGRQTVNPIWAAGKVLSLLLEAKAWAER